MLNQDVYKRQRVISIMFLARRTLATRVVDWAAKYLKKELALTFTGISDRPFSLAEAVTQQAEEKNQLLWRTVACHPSYCVADRSVVTHTLRLKPLHHGV